MVIKKSVQQGKIDMIKKFPFKNVGDVYKDLLSFDD